MQLSFVLVNKGLFSAFSAVQRSFSNFHNDKPHDICKNMLVSFIKSFAIIINRISAAVYQMTFDLYALGPSVWEPPV